MTARRLTSRSNGGPFGTAQDTSTPECSRRKSQCRLRAWCSWMTKVGSSPSPRSRPVGGSAGTGSEVFPGSRIDRYVARRSMASSPGPASSASSRPSGAMGSSPSATRSSTSSMRRCARSGAAISSHVRGAATVGCPRPRREYGLTVVLEALFWLQSRNTFPARSALRIREMTRSGWSDSRPRASSRATFEMVSELFEPSSAAYRWMPFDPEVTGNDSMPMPSRTSRHHRATSAHSARPTPSPGSRSSTSRSGLRGCPLRPNRHCGTCSSSAATCANHASTAGSSASG